MRDISTIEDRPELAVGNEVDVRVPVSGAAHRRVRGTVSRIVETDDFAVVVVQSDNGINIIKVL